MGTSGSYGGSAGVNWNELQGELDDWLDGLPTPSDTDAPPAPVVDPNVARILNPLGHALMSGGRGVGGGPSNGGGGGSGTRGTSPSGTGRSRARTAQVGGRLASGLRGLATGNAAALAELGLDLAELSALDPYRQAARLIEAATEEPVAATLEEDELRKAANRTAIWAIEAGEPPDIASIIRHFVVEYVFEVFLTEAGSTMRSGERDGTDALAAEGRVRATIEALARAVRIDDTGPAVQSISVTVETVLQQTVTIHGDHT